MPVVRFVPLVLLAACASHPAGGDRLGRVPSGEWGGQHVRLTVEESGAKVEFDCAHGSLDQPLLLDPDGRFDVAGSLVTEGGPVRQDEPENSRPARYRGETDGERMSLAVTLEGGEDAGTFSLTRGGQANLLKCL